MYDLRFIRIADLKETKVLWHNGRRGDKQTGDQQFESHTQLEVNSSRGCFDFRKINAKFNAKYVRSTLNSTLIM